MERILFINFKTYEQSTGKNALKLAKIAESAAKKHNKKIVLVVQPFDLQEIAKSVRLEIFAQHIDPVVYGANTGSILPEAVKQAGAIGTILNHAEKKVDDFFLEKAIARAKEVNLKVMCCAENIERAKKIASFKAKPDLIAIEPPELIGGTISVSEAKPEIIEDAVKEVQAVTMKDMGKVMKVAAEKIAGRADNKEVSELVKQALANR